MSRDFDFNIIEIEGVIPDSETLVAWTIREAIARDAFLKKYRESYPEMSWESRPSQYSPTYYGTTKVSFHDDAEAVAIGIVSAMRDLDMSLPEIIGSLVKADRALKEIK